MDPDVKAFYYALGYNGVVLILALSAWIWGIRRTRQDEFRPNPRRKKLFPSEGGTGDAAIDVDASPESATSWSSRCCLPANNHWLIQLWRWDIEKFTSTDTYLYLLFLKKSSVMFLLLSVISVGCAFPVIWTARSVAYEGGVRQRGFFERAVITNIPSDDFRRLWVIYAIVWAIALFSIYCTWRLYQMVRSDDFRVAALLTNGAAARRRNKQQAANQRFMPSKYSVAITGLDRNLLTGATIRKSLLAFFEEEEIVALHVVMDHSEALAAQRGFQVYLSKLMSAQQQQQAAIQKASQNQATTTSKWAIKLPCCQDRPDELTSDSHTDSPRLEKPRSGDDVAINLTETGPGNLYKVTPQNAVTDVQSELGEPLLESRPQAESSQRNKPAELEGSRAREDGGGLSSSSSSSCLSVSHLDEVLVIPALLTRAKDTEFSLDGSSEAFRSARSALPIEMPPISAKFSKGVTSPSPSSQSSNNDDNEQGYDASPPSKLFVSHILGDSALTNEGLPNTAQSRRRNILQCGRRTPQENISRWEAKVLSQYSVLNRMRSRTPTRNVGMVFVSFRHPGAARFALSHDFGDPACPVFRARFRQGGEEADPCGVCGSVCSGGHLCTQKRGWNPKWKLREAPPPEDIVWENLHHSPAGRLSRRIAANLCIFLLSLVLTSSALAADALNPFAQHIENMLENLSFLRMSVSGWIAPLVLYLINALLLPFLVAWAASESKFWRNSSRDRAVLHGNINFMVLNSLIFPVIGTTSIQGILLWVYTTKVSNLFTVLGQLVAGASGSFMLRYVLNTLFINSSFQLLQLPMFSQQWFMLRMGKKPVRWSFDFGYWYAFHLSVLAVCLTFSVDMPLVPPLGFMFFLAKYWVDKYNFSFSVWRVTCESAGAVASTVVSFMLGFVSLFLLIMASYFVAVGLHSATLRPEGNDHFLVTKRHLNVHVPSQTGPRAVVIGGLILLASSLAMFLITFGERVQRSIVDRHAGKLRRIGRAIWVNAFAYHDSIPFQTSVSRLLADWEIVVPQRGVVETGPEEAELDPLQMDMLRKAYAHPYEREEAYLSNLVD